MILMRGVKEGSRFREDKFLDKPQRDRAYTPGHVSVHSNLCGS